MKMKIAAAVVGLAMLSTGWASAKEDGIKVDMTGSAIMTMPQKDTASYKNGFGAEGWLRLWLNDYIGIGGSGALEYWPVKTTALNGVTNKDPAIYPIPVGPSLLLRLPLNKETAIVFDGGVRYVPIVSNVEILGEKADFNPAVLATIGANLEANLSSSFFIFGGAGYSFEVTTPDLKVAGQKIDEIHLRYAAIRAGLGIRF